MDPSVVHRSRAQERSNVIVRRFSDDLAGDSALSVGTKVVVAQIDAEIEARDRMRAQSHFEEFDENSRPFDKCEVARKALEYASDEFFKSMEKKSSESKFSVFGKSRRDAKIQVEQRMRQSTGKSLEDVKGLVEGMADDWKRSHGKPYSYFTHMCKTLNAHRDLLKVVPQQNTYVSVLSGALSMVVQASVYHDQIAEDLSATTAHVCERVAVCSELLEVIKRDSMHRQLAEVYRAFFKFLLRVAEWFNKSSTSRFFDSFNKDVKARHEEAVADINRSIDMMIEQGGVEELARVEYIRRTADIIEWKVDKLNEAVVPFMAEMRTNMGTLVDEVRMRGHIQSQEDLVQIGRCMVQLLLDQAAPHIRAVVGQELRAQGILERTRAEERASNRFRIPDTVPSQTATLISREEADVRSKPLQGFVHGSDGLALIKASQALVAEAHVLACTARWIQGGALQPQRLWIQYPFEYQADTSARATALGVILTAARANAPFLSYICTKPPRANIAASLSVKEAGLSSMVYSLILQLLRFRPEKDGFKVDAAVLNGLGEGMDSWKDAVGLLRLLLEHTPVVRYCVIHGLNELEGSGNEERCKEFLEVLELASLRPNDPLSVLFTTSGQSRVLGDATTRDERAMSNAGIREVHKRGQAFHGLRI